MSTAPPPAILPFAPAHERPESLRPMLQARTRPVFRRIRNQLLWEAVVFSAILIGYYDAFDGARRPLYALVALIAAAAGIIVHSVLGYRQFSPTGETLPLGEALEQKLNKMRVYAVWSVVSRGAWTVAMAVFFCAAVTVLLVVSRTA